MTDSQDLHADLAQELQEFWQDYTSIRPSRIRVVADEQTIAVCLDQVLTSAEREMACTRTGRDMLKELEKHILEQASDAPDFAQQHSTMRQRHRGSRGLLPVL